MRVFLTGGTGYVGSFLVKHFSKQSYELTVLARDPSRSPEIAALPGVRIVQDDIRNTDSLEPYLAGQDAIIHNSLIWDMSGSEDSDEDCDVSNRLFVMAKELAIPQILYTSSTAVHRPFTRLMDESSVLYPENMEPYAHVKHTSERSAIDKSLSSKTRVNIIRLGPVIGQTAFHSTRLKSDRTLEAIVRSAIEGRDIPLSETVGRQFISGADVPRLYQAVLESDCNREIFIAVDSNIMPWRDIAEIAIEAAQSKSKIIMLPEEPEPFDFKVDKISRFFDIKFDSREAIRSHVYQLVNQLKA